MRRFQDQTRGVVVTGRGIGGASDAAFATGQMLSVSGVSGGLTMNG